MAVYSWTGTSGNDSLNYTGPDTLSANGMSGDDYIWGNNGNDTIYGGNGNDTLKGYYGNDYLSGGDGNDTLYGEDGNDTLDGGFGFDSIDGGAGIDTVTYSFYSGGIVANLQTGVVSFPGNSPLTDTLSGIENVIGSSGSDILIGNGVNNLLNGGDGNDNINGGDGNDTVIGGNGNDILTGGTGADTFIFNSLSQGLDTITDFAWSQGDKIQVSAFGFGIGTSDYNKFSYNNGTGALLFDSDGFGVGAASVQFASLQPSLDVVPSLDIIIV